MQQLLHCFVSCVGVAFDILMVDELGFRQLVMKTNSEPSFITVCDAMVRNRFHDNFGENPPANDTQANSGVSTAIGQVMA